MEIFPCEQSVAPRVRLWVTPPCGILNYHHRCPASLSGRSGPTGSPVLSPPPCGWMCYSLCLQGRADPEPPRSQEFYLLDRTSSPRAIGHPCNSDQGQKPAPLYVVRMDGKTAGQREATGGPTAQDHTRASLDLCMA